MSQGVPAVEFYPCINLPPFRRIPLIYELYWPISNGNFVVPYMIIVPFNGKLKVRVVLSESGTFALYGVNGNQNISYMFNGGNALNANTVYEFDIYVTAGTVINFQWTSSSSSVTSAYIDLYVYLEPEGCESGSE